MSAFVSPGAPRAGVARSTPARVIVQVLDPAGLIILTVLAIGWHSTRGLVGLGWAAFAVLVCAIIPAGLFALGLRRESLTDRQRVAALGGGIPFVAAGVALLYALHAPDDVRAAVVALILALLTLMPITLWWQISIHGVVASSTVTICMLTFGEVSLLLLGVTGAVVCVRSKCKAHTPAQIIAGVVLGSLGAVPFAILR